MYYFVDKINWESLIGIHIIVDQKLEGLYGNRSLLVLVVAQKKLWLSYLDWLIGNPYIWNINEMITKLFIYISNKRKVVMIKQQLKPLAQIQQYTSVIYLDSM